MYVSLVLLNDLDFGTHTTEGKFLIRGDLRGGPAVKPFCRVGGEVDAAVGARSAEVVVPESAVE